MMNPNQPRTVGQPVPMTAPQAAPVIPIGPDPAQQKLMRAMMGRQMQELSQARTPQEAIGRALPLYAATFRNYQDQQSAKERQEALTKALTGAEDYDSLIGAMISSGDPGYQKAAVSQRLSQFAPKPPEKPLRGKERFISTGAGIFDTVNETIVPGTEKAGKDDKPIKVGDALVQEQEDGTYAPVYEAPAKGAPMNATSMKEVFEADEGVQASTNVLTSLDAALELNDKAYSGFGAQTRGYVGSLFGLEGGESTEELQNVVTRQVLDNLKATFGGMPTEGERQVLLDVQGSVNKSPEVRKRIFERARDAAQRRLEFNKAKAAGIRSGDYFQPGFETPSAPPAANQTVQPKDGTKRLRFNPETGELE